MLLKVLQYPHPLLRCPVSMVDFSREEGLVKLTTDMLETMYAYHGVGLAAPQVGISKSIVVIDVRDKANVDVDECLPEDVQDVLTRNPRILINPQLTFPNTQRQLSSEGCLSVNSKKVLTTNPQSLQISRYRDVIVHYFDLQGQPHTLTASNNLLSICLQHECDHLAGKLFIDYLDTTTYHNLEQTSNVSGS